MRLLVWKVQVILRTSQGDQSRVCLGFFFFNLNGVVSVEIPPMRAARGEMEL